jgi:hypothetical protein
MIILKKILSWLTIILAVFIIQTLTFLTIGPKQLKSKLLPEQLIINKSNSDSVFVRDYYTTDCISGDFYTLNHSLNLENYSDELREKLGVRFIHFADNATSTWEDQTPNTYPLVYEAYARSGDWSSLFGLYESRVDEVLMERKGEYFAGTQKTTHYRWYLFFWVQIYENYDSWENRSRDN